MLSRLGTMRKEAVVDTPVRAFSEDHFPQICFMGPVPDGPEKGALMMSHMYTSTGARGSAAPGKEHR